MRSTCAAVASAFNPRLTLAGLHVDVASAFNMDAYRRAVALTGPIATRPTPEGFDTYMRRFYFRLRWHRVLG